MRFLPFAYTLVSLGLDMALMVLAVQKHLQMTKGITLNNFQKNNFSKKSIPGEVLYLGLRLGVFGLGLARMVLVVRKQLQMIRWITLNISYQNSFSKKLIPG